MASRIKRPDTAFMGGGKSTKGSTEAHRRFIASLECLVPYCRRTDCQCAHVRFGDVDFGKHETGAARKPGDQWTVPLCVDHHVHQHAMGERAFWIAVARVDPLTVAALLWLHTGNKVAALSVIRNAGFAFPARMGL